MTARVSQANRKGTNNQQARCEELGFGVTTDDRNKVIVAED